MDKKIRKFDDIEIEEYTFHQYKIRISINGIDIKDIVVSNKLPLNISVVTRMITNYLEIINYIEDNFIILNVCII